MKEYRIFVSGAQKELKAEISIQFPNHCLEDLNSFEMIKQCREKGLPEPDFISVSNLEFKTILARDIFTEDVLSRMGLNERQMKAVKYVKQKGKITNKEYREICQTSGRTATRDLAHLTAIKIFEQQGITGQGTEYILRRHKDAKDATQTPPRRQNRHL